MTHTTGHANRLINETSPYLLQHAYNPVQWQPWDDEALEKAREEDKPVFLSIGYAACHWCHVMEHESFEDTEVAGLLNEHFVPIKVDREERPDLDNIYMKATQLMTGSGGWPMSVFLTPKLEPFYAGTYFPPEDRYGRPGFKTLLAALAKAWDEKRDEVLDNAVKTLEYLAETEKQEAGGGAIKADIPVQAAIHLTRQFDAHLGGWGGAPKFPSAPANAFLLRRYIQTGDANALAMAETTLQAMARGGMYDQLGGGFHRYSVDSQWLVPHFEKMLYDNAQLVPVYLEAWQLTKNPFYRRVAVETLEYELRDMRDPSGAFHASEDADSEGEEGKFYTWRYADLEDVLGHEDAEIFCAYYGVDPAGNFSSQEPYHRYQNILHRPRTHEEFARTFGYDEAKLEQRLGEARTKLLHVRSQRTRPGLDDKVLTSWNALMISALAKAAQALGERRYGQAAVEAARFILEKMRAKDGGLLRTHRHGESRLPAYLDDYAFLIAALCDLYETTFDLRWLEEAEALCDGMIGRFGDGGGGGFFFTGPEHANLVVRMRPTFDGSEPSGNSMAAHGLLRLAKLLNRPDYFEKAEATMASVASDMAQYPQAYLNMILAVDRYLDPGKEIALVGGLDDPETQRSIETVHERFLPGRTLALLDPSWHNAAEVQRRVPLLAGKKLLDGGPAAYVCKDFSCKQPVTTPQELAMMLDADPV